MRTGNLSVSNLAQWLDRPVPTVRGWVERGREPQGGPQDTEHVYSLVGLLETMIRRETFFPLPRMSPAERKRRVVEIRQKVLP